MGVSPGPAGGGDPATQARLLQLRETGEASLPEDRGPAAGVGARAPHNAAELPRPDLRPKRRSCGRVVCLGCLQVASRCVSH